MKSLQQFGVSFCADESGVTAIEYAMIAGLIAVVIAAAVTSIGTIVNSMYIRISSCFPSGAC